MRWLLHPPTYTWFLIGNWSDDCQLKTATLAGKHQQEFRAVTPAFNAGEAVVEISESR
jgi:hypothetical protein